MSYSASKRWMLVVAVVALTASSPNPGIRTTAVVDVRPSVALLVTIDARDYLQKIADTLCALECRVVRDALADSALAIVRGTYPFLNWDDPQHATDTIYVRLTSKAGYVPALLLDLRVVSASARMPPESTLVDFENYKAYRERDESDDWSVDSLRRQWAKRMRETLRSENLVESVFGQIPVNVSAHSLQGVRWLVNLASEDINQATYERPTFEVRPMYRSAVEGNDSVAVSLGDCMEWDERKAYNCKVSQIVFRSHRVVTGDSIAPVLSKATLDPVSRVHLVTFKANPSRTSGGGTWH
jgi:hypothetical protein